MTPASRAERSEASPSDAVDGGSLLTLAERVLGTLVLLFALGALLGGGHAWNRHQQRTAFDAEASALAGALERTVAELDTLVRTLVGVHTADAGADELVALAAELRTGHAAVTAVGRYASVAGARRAEFERGLLDSGLYDFRIVELDADGHRRGRADAPRHYPVSLLEPMAPSRLRLIGADLGAIDGLDAALERIAATDGSLLTTLPPSWPTGGELLLAHPTYRGKQVPSALAERLRQSDGGYWLAADPARLLADLDERLGRFGVTLSVEDAAGAERTLLARDAVGARTADDGAGRTLEHRLRLGDGELVLRLEGRLGTAPGLLGGLVAIAVLILVSALVVVVSVRRDRLARRERRRSLLRLQRERERADRTLNAIDDAVFALDVERRISHLNPAAARLAGDARVGVLHRRLDDVLALRHERSDEPLDLEAVLAASDAGGARELDVTPRRDADGKAAGARPAVGPPTVLRLTISRMHEADGTISGHIVVLRDISDERLLTRQLEFQADHDALTGCTNRRWFERRLGELLGDLPGSGRRHALCYLDLDQFKIVNDTNGHAAGDRLLQELTGELQGVCRGEASLSRLGGDEFGLLIVDVDEAGARRVVERIYDFFQGYLFHHGDDAFAIRASIGLVPLDERSGTIGDVLAAADLACYAAKEGGRNGLYVYSADDETMSRRSAELGRLPELQRALAEDRFELHVQAVARLGGPGAVPEVTHFEFLLRLTGEDGLAVTPFRIIEAAERYGLMREIDRWVIARALATVATLADGPGRDCSFSINLSGQSAADPTLIDFIESEYARHAIDPSRIWFELTETAAISHFSIAVDLATRIRALGSRVALDDFGSGLSSFGYLKHIPVDVLKIDGQFVRHIVDDAVDRTVVRAIDEVGKSMGIVTVAEFVEDQAIVEALQRIGIDYAQGYHLGRPVPLAEALAALAAPVRFAA